VLKWRRTGCIRLYIVVPRLVSFIDQLTNIYVRYNRKRLKVRARGLGLSGGGSLAFVLGFGA
jgi:hypothetical protein